MPTRAGDAVIRSSQKKFTAIWYVAAIPDDGAQPAASFAGDRLVFSFQDAVDAALAVISAAHGRIFQLDVDTGEWRIIHETHG
jgi:hypothetical protein